MGQPHPQLYTKPRRSQRVGRFALAESGSERRLQTPPTSKRGDINLLVFFFFHLFFSCLDSVWALASYSPYSIVGGRRGRLNWCSALLWRAHGFPTPPHHAACSPGGANQLPPVDYPSTRKMATWKYTIPLILVKFGEGGGANERDKSRHSIPHPRLFSITQPLLYIYSADTVCVLLYTICALDYQPPALIK